MSTILKALRRLEEDKRTQTAMSLDEAVVEPQSSSGRSGRAIVFATAASALAGVAALLWATSGIWLPRGEDAQRDGSVAAQPAPNSPAPMAAAPTAQLPAPSPPIPIRAPGQTAVVEAFENPQEIRREMQRLAGFSPEPMEASLVDAASPPDVVATPKAKPAAKPKPRAAPVVVKPQTRAKAKAKPAPKATVVASKAAPAVAAPASVGPVEVIRRDAAPGISIRQISWHPRPDRRVATFVVEGESSALPKREGEKVAGYTIEEIGISEVELVRNGVSVRRRVGD